MLRKAFRITAYEGMLSLRLEAQRDSAPPTAAPPPPAGATSHRPAAASRPAAGRLQQGAKVVPVAAMGLAFPGLIDRRTSAPPEAPPEGTTTPHD